GVFDRFSVGRVREIKRIPNTRFCRGLSLEGREDACHRQMPPVDMQSSGSGQATSLVRKSISGPDVPATTLVKSMSCRGTLINTVPPAIRLRQAKAPQSCVCKCGLDPQLAFGLRRDPFPYFPDNLVNLERRQQSWF